MVPMVVFLLMVVAMLLGAFGALLVDLNKVYFHSISIRLRKWFGKRKEDPFHREENEFGLHVGELQEFGNSQQGLRLRSGSHSDLPLPRPHGGGHSHFGTKTPPSKTHKQTSPSVPIPPLLLPQGRESSIPMPSPEDRWGSKATSPTANLVPAGQQQRVSRHPLPPKLPQRRKTSTGIPAADNACSPEWVDPWTYAPQQDGAPEILLDVSFGTAVSEELPTPTACHAGERKPSFHIPGPDGGSGSPHILPIVPEHQQDLRDADLSAFGTAAPTSGEKLWDSLELQETIETPKMGNRMKQFKGFSHEDGLLRAATQKLEGFQKAGQGAGIDNKKAGVSQGLKHSSPIFGKRRLNVKKDNQDNLPWALLERSRSEELQSNRVPSRGDEPMSSPLQKAGEKAMEMGSDKGHHWDHPEPVNPKVPHPTAACHWEIDFSEIELREVIGGGGFGQVYKAKWRETTVAVKMLLAQAQLDEEMVKDFKAEVAILAGLRHPNICLFMGACLNPPHRAIITELVSRGSLWDALRTTHPRREPIESFPTPPEAWPWSIIQKIAHDTACGMAYLHSNQPAILHRDLKSANLLLDGSYTVKLADFGLARLKAITNSMTGNCGTVQWMAPEVLGNQKYSESADVFSFAIVCWEMLSKVCPYEGMSQIQVAMAVLNHGLRPKIPGWCPDHFRQMIEACWKQNPAERPPFRDILQLIET